MKLLLANLDLYQNWIDRGATKFTGFDAEAYNQASAKDYGEYFMSGSDAVIQVTGPLSYKYDFWSWLMDGSSYQGLMAQIQGASANTEVSRIVMLMDTPGGEITGLPEASKAIVNCGKPVVAVVDPCCASAGLWLASQAGRIVSIESGEIGSLGVQCMAVSYAKMFEESGLDVKLFRAAISPDKNMAHPYEPISDKATEYLQDRVDRAGERFVETVAAGRNVSTEDVLAKFGQGKMLDAEEALSVGLIDDIGTLAGVLSESRIGTSTKSNRRRAEYRRSRV
jgi:capsid assembly protease